MDKENHTSANKYLKHIGLKYTRFLMMQKGGQMKSLTEQQELMSVWKGK